MALGAEPGQIRGLVSKPIGHMTLVGGIGGLLLAVAIARTARTLLFELEPSDPFIWPKTADQIFESLKIYRSRTPNKGQ